MPWIVASVCMLCLVLWTLLLRPRRSLSHRGSLLRAGCAWILTGTVLWLFSGVATMTAIPCGGLRVTLVGVVADPPTRTTSGFRFLVRPQWVTVAGDSLSVRGLVAVTLLVRPGHDPLVAPGYGTRLCLRGLLTEPPGVRNPGEFDLRQFYRANGIRALLLVRGADGYRALPGSRGSWLYRTVVLPVRQRILAYIDRAIGGTEGEFLKGLLLGIRTGMAPEMREAFVNAGVAHILAVSGSNVAVIAGFLYGVLLLLRVPSCAPRGACCCRDRLLHDPDRFAATRRARHHHGSPRACGQAHGAAGLRSQFPRRGGHSHSPS